MLDKRYDAAISEVIFRCSNELSHEIASSELARGGLSSLENKVGELVDALPLLAELDESARKDAAHLVLNDLYQLGPIEELLEDSHVNEIMVNGPDEVYVERGGVISKTDVHFFDDDHLRRIITKIVSADGRRCDQQSPMCDCVLHRAGTRFDGSRVNAVWQPIAVDHPTLTIRKYRDDLLSPDSLIGAGTSDRKTMDLLRSLVCARMNIVVIGGAGAGKTTLLNALSSFIPANQRIVTIEDTAELNLDQEHVVRLSSRDPNTENEGEITIRQLVRNAMRMRPDRIVVGECRGGEAFDMVRAMGTGHEGCLATFHARTPRQSLDTLTTMVQMSPEGSQMPPAGIMRIITESIDFVIQMERYRDGARRIAEIMELCSMQDDIAVTAPIIRFEQQCDEGEQRITGKWQPTGSRLSPDHSRRLSAAGIDIDPECFDNGRLW